VESFEFVVAVGSLSLGVVGFVVAVVDVGVEDWVGSGAGALVAKQPEQL